MLFSLYFFLFCILTNFILKWDLKIFQGYKKKTLNSYVWYLHLKNKVKYHNYTILNYKCSARKTTGQWTYIYGQGDQRVNEGQENQKISWILKLNSFSQFFSHWNETFCYICYEAFKLLLSMIIANKDYAKVSVVFMKLNF